MALREKVLLKKAEKFESKELQKTLVSQEQIIVLGKLLNEAYAIRRPKPSEYEDRKQLIRVFNDIAKELYGNSSSCPVVEEFGSFSMDLFTSESDLDLSVNFRSREHVFPRDQKIKTLRKFARKFYALQNVGHVRGVQPIMTAKVPILKVVDIGTGVECDLSVENRDGISKSAIIRCITSVDERFQKLSFLMKAWAKRHDINSSKDRTLNSLSIILLVAFHLQTRNPPILPPFSAILQDGEDVPSVMKSVRKFQNYGKSNTETVGELFVSFFIKLASIERLWPKGLCASPYLGHWTSKTWDTKIASMSVEDFTDRTQNVARAVGKSEVSKIFQSIKLTIQKLCSFMNGGIEESKLKEYLFGSVEPKLNIKPVAILKRKQNPGTNLHDMPTNPLLTMNLLSSPNGVMDLRAAPNWPTRPPSVGYWGKTHHQSFDHHPTKRMRAAEGAPVTQGWGGYEWRPSWGGAPSGSWGGIPEDPFQRSQEMQLDHWGRMPQRPPNGNSLYGQPLR